MTETEYNTDFLVKYHDIKEELLEKKRLETEEYTDEELNLVIDELYRHELLSVFRSEDICDKKIVTIMNQLWLSLEKYEPFNEIILLFKERKICDSNIDLDYVFTSLFSYDTFYLLHKCICEFLSKREISSELLEEFKKLIENL
jgi:hypothetical protein